MTTRTATSPTHVAWDDLTDSMAIGTLHSMALIGVRHIGAATIAGTTLGMTHGMDPITPDGMAHTGTMDGALTTDGVATMVGAGPIMDVVDGMVRDIMPTADLLAHATMPMVVDDSSASATQTTTTTATEVLATATTPTIVHAGTTTTAALSATDATTRSMTTTAISSSRSVHRTTTPTTTDLAATVDRLVEVADLAATAVRSAAVAVRSVAVEAVAVDLAIADNQLM